MIHTGNLFEFINQKSGGNCSRKLNENVYLERDHGRMDLEHGEKKCPVAFYSVNTY